MEQLAWACTRCARTIGPGDTIMFRAGGLAHVDCRRPRVLSTEERALLFLHCCDHSVECAPCASRFCLSELGSDLRGHTNLCPHCRQDLTDGVRAHLHKCDMISEEVRRRAQAVRAVSERLVKESYEPGGRRSVEAGDRDCSSGTQGGHAGIVRRYSRGRFRSNASVTRSRGAVLIARAVGYLHKPLNRRDPAGPGTISAFGLA